MTEIVYLKESRIALLVSCCLWLWYRATKKISIHLHPPSDKIIYYWFSLSLSICSHQCDQIWPNFATLAKLYKSLANSWGFIKCLTKFWKKYVFGSQILKNNLAIWSHWFTLAFGYTTNDITHFTLKLLSKLEISGSVTRHWNIK